jgi:hypothetical protein
MRCQAARDLMRTYQQHWVLQCALAKKSEEVRFCYAFHLDPFEIIVFEGGEPHGSVF